MCPTQQGTPSKARALRPVHRCSQLTTNGAQFWCAAAVARARVNLGVRRSERPALSRLLRGGTIDRLPRVSTVQRAIGQALLLHTLHSTEFF